MANAAQTSKASDVTELQFLPRETQKFAVGGLTPLKS
jgi:hypothetical protein